MELIDRDALITAMCVACANGVVDSSCEYSDEGCGTIEIINQQPKVEAEPVRHGRMIEGRYPNEDKCSECGQIFRDDIWFIYPYDENGVCKTPKRCPDCGCYWDGGA